MSKVMKIIHVDTNKYALYEMRKDISQNIPNAELHSFVGVKPALAFAEAHDCDVLLTEVVLWTDQLGGIKLAKAIQELDPQVNIIIVTICDEYEISSELSELRISGYFTKPWNTKELSTVLQNLNR